MLIGSHTSRCSTSVQRSTHLIDSLTQLIHWPVTASSSSSNPLESLNFDHHFVRQRITIPSRESSQRRRTRSANEIDTNWACLGIGARVYAQATGARWSHRCLTIPPESRGFWLDTTSYRRYLASNIDQQHYIHGM